jgi:large subunit ribosomal protein L28
MARRCDLTGTDAQFGCNVSHSHRRTNRRFSPNVQKVALLSEALGREVRLRITTRALRTVQKKGGLDSFLLGTDDSKLHDVGLRLKRQIKKRINRPRKAAAG